MIINTLNYEVFLVDYLDGKLNPSLVDELLLFLDHNPDIKNDLEGIQDTVLVAENDVFPNKSTLKKKSFLKYGIDNEFDYLCIASVEGVLTQEENSSLQKIVKEDHLKHDQLKAYQKAIIVPDKSIAFSNKLRLKRTSIIPMRYSNYRLSISIAASITLLIGVYTIGRMILKDNPLESYSNNTIAESKIPAVKKIVEDIPNKKTSTYSEERKTSPQQTLISKEIPVEVEEERARINIEESIPNMIRPKGIKGISIQETHHEELVELTAKYTSENQLLLEQLYAQQEAKANQEKDYSTFEVVQFGVRSVGKLFGRDIKLDANKDNKGKIKKIIFESQLVAFSTQVNNNE